MPEKIFEPNLPSGFSRFAFRLPIWLFRAHLGWVLGDRFLLLTHIGRKSGLPRQTVIEVVRHDRASGVCIVASGWGDQSDWYKNVTANPKLVFQIGNRRTNAIAERLSPEKGAQELFDYAHHHPLAMQELAKFMGYRLNGTDADIRALGRMIPMFIIKPISEEK